MPILAKPTIRVCLRLFEDDYDKVREMSEKTGVGINTIVRECIGDYIMRVRDRERQSIDRRSATTNQNQKLPIPISDGDS